MAFASRERTASSRTRRAATSRRAPASRSAPRPSAPCRRAISVEICSGDGSGRVSSENWTMRAGRGIDGDDHAIDGRGGRMRFEIEQRQRAQRARVAHRRRQLQRPLVHGRASPGAAARAARRRRDRAARGAPRAAPAAGRARTTAARAPRSATRDRAPARSAPPAPPARSGRGSSPRASRCHAHASCPSRAATSSGGSAANSPSVRSPHRRKRDEQLVRVVRRSERSSRGVRSVRDVREQRRAAAVTASASASVPGSTTVMPGAMVDEQARRRARAGDRHAHAQTAIGGRAPQLAGNRPRVAEQPLEAVQIERDLARAAHLDTRRELARHARERSRGGSLRRV